MFSSLIGAVAWNNLVFDLAIAAILVLYFLWGFFKGFVKPLTALISWGVIILVFYFGGSFIGDFLIGKTGIEPFILNILQNFMDAQAASSIMKYIGLGLAAICIFIVVKLITFIINIIIKRSIKAHRKTALDIVFGGLLNIIKGALWVCIILAILIPIAQKFNIQEVTNMINGSTVTKYIVQYNPITMLVNLIIK